MGHTIKIRPDGSIQFIWNDTFARLFHKGEGKIMRASNVEPTENGLWVADLSPVSGPALGPYTERGEALAAEVDWLEKNLIGI